MAGIPVEREAREARQLECGGGDRRTRRNRAEVEPQEPERRPGSAAVARRSSVHVEGRVASVPYGIARADERVGLGGDRHRIGEAGGHDDECREDRDDERTPELTPRFFPHRIPTVPRVSCHRRQVSHPARVVRELDRLRKRQVASFVLQRFGLGAERCARGSERRVELRGERGWPRSADLLPQCERRAVEPDRVGRVAGQRGEAADVLEQERERPAVVVASLARRLAA